MVAQTQSVSTVVPTNTQPAVVQSYSAAKKVTTPKTTTALLLSWEQMDVCFIHRTAFHRNFKLLKQVVSEAFKPTEDPNGFFLKLENNSLVTTVDNSEPAFYLTDFPVLFSLEEWNSLLSMNIQTLDGRYAPFLTILHNCGGYLNLGLADLQYQPPFLALNNAS